MPTSTRHHREKIIFLVPKLKIFTPKKSIFGVPPAQKSLSPPRLPPTGPLRPWCKKKKKSFSLSNTAIHDLGTMPMSSRHHRKEIIFLVQKVKIFTPKSCIFHHFLHTFCVPSLHASTSSRLEARSIVVCLKFPP